MIARGTLFFEINIYIVYSTLYFKKEVDPRGPPVEGSKAIESVSKRTGCSMCLKKVHQRDRVGADKEKGENKKNESDR